MQVNMHEAKSQLSKLGEKVCNGGTVIIAKSGKPYLELIPHKPLKQVRKPGKYKNQIKLSDSFNHEYDEINKLFEAEL